MKPVKFWKFAHGKIYPDRDFVSLTWTQYRVSSQSGEN
jgi:hypothetical protein